MAEITHGISTSRKGTSVSVPQVAESGIIFAVGTAPIQTVNGKTNEVIMANSYEEAVKAVGYSDDWEKYGLCELIYTAFQLYQAGPVFFVNVLDPKKHKQVKVILKEVTENQIKLPFETIAGSIKITGKEAGEDFGVFYENGNCIVEFLADTSGEISVEYEEVDPGKVLKSDIIGGYDVATHKTTGLELIDSILPKYTNIPDLILCPGWSHDSEVGAVMSAKAENINGMFEAMVLLDVDTRPETGVAHYSEVPNWKKERNLTKANELVCFPKLKLGERTFHLSTQLAGLIAKTDNDSDLGKGTPRESASNKALQADSMVLADGTEVLLDVQQANFLNDNGIITALNFYNGFVSWGDWTACFPGSTDPVEYYYCVSRMFKWVAKTVILSYWPKTDRSMTERLIDTILQGVNDWLNGLTAEEIIIGGRVELRDEENTLTSLMSGKGKFHIYLTPPVPLVQMEFVLEYDVTYLSNLLSA